MIEEIGTVVDVYDGRALVRTERSSACEGCASAGFCQVIEGKDECTVEAQNPSLAAIGQKVRIAIPTSLFLKGTFLLYIFPLFGLFSGMAAGYSLADHLFQGDEELFASVGSLLGLVLFFIFQRLFNRSLEKNQKFRPVIVDII